MNRCTTALLVCLFYASVIVAQHEYNPMVKGASAEPAATLKRIKLPAGFSSRVFAAEPLLANPVAFTLDNQLRCYVAETFRLHAGVTDIRSHMDWLDDDLACRTVADRDRMYQKKLGDKAATYGEHHDRVRVLFDTDGDGVADKADVFADGFKNRVDGIGAGLLARGNKVWFTCIPDLWLLESEGAGTKAVKRKSLSTGYGVHVGFLGHDLHGLVMGPDGRIYFSIGDRGLNVSGLKGPAVLPDTGAVLRCEPDGSKLEVFAYGLRNPQELAFDDLGELFTGDNNSDGGDQARWTHLVDQGDSGWRIGYQFLEKPTARGAWNLEGMWKPRHPAQPAYIIPPLANVGAGPSGLAAYPGTGLPEKYNGSFMMCDFRGGSGGSGVHAIWHKPKGATFEFIRREDFIWSLLVTDVEFGVDGQVYVSDWTEGWGLPMKGRIYSTRHDAEYAKPIVKDTQKLLQGDWTKAETSVLAQCLGHADRRVRQEAHLELARRGDVATLSQSLATNSSQLARVHAIWGLSVAHRHQTAGATAAVLAAGTDKDPEIRSQAARALGEMSGNDSAKALKALVLDTNPRVAARAALALARHAAPDAATQATTALRTNDNSDPVLRHAAALLLARSSDANSLMQVAKDASAAVRLGAVLALRRMENPSSAVAAVLVNDGDAAVATEAARLIHDLPIDGAREALGKKTETPGAPEALLRRALASRYRMGRAEDAMALAAFAGRPNVSDSLRVEALNYLTTWAKPSGRDSVVGLWRPLEARDAEPARTAIRANLGALLASPATVRSAAVQAAAGLGLKDLAPALGELAMDAALPAMARVEALEALFGLDAVKFDSLVSKGMADSEPRVRARTLALTARRDATKARPMVEKALQTGTLWEKQAAVVALGTDKTTNSKALLAPLIDSLKAGTVEPGLALEVAEAAKAQATNPKERSVIDDLEKKGKYRDCLTGGDAEAGRRIYAHKAEVSCVRCHALKGSGGIVGPALDTLAIKKDRNYLLESIVEPNKAIAQGYETVVISLKNGKTITGVLRSGTGGQMKLVTAEGVELTVPLADIDEHERGPSAMPADIVNKLSRRELRDLVEFLASLR